MVGWKHVASRRTVEEAVAWANDQAAKGLQVRVDLSVDVKGKLYVCRLRRSSKPRRIFQGDGVGARLTFGGPDKPVAEGGSIRWRADGPASGDYQSL